MSAPSPRKVCMRIPGFTVEQKFQGFAAERKSARALSSPSPTAPGRRPGAAYARLNVFRGRPAAPSRHVRRAAQRAGTVAATTSPARRVFQEVSE